MQLPTPDDTLHAHRIRKRTNGYNAILRTPEYAAAQRALAEGRIPTMPPEPNPNDLSVSKRTWETTVQQWRLSLQQIAQQHSRVHTTTEVSHTDT